MDSGAELFYATRSMGQLNLGMVAGKIATYNFEWRFITVVLLASANPHTLQSFLQYYNKTIILNYHECKPIWVHFVTQYVLLGHETSDITPLIAKIEGSQLNFDGKFIIVCTSNSNCDEQQIYQSMYDRKVDNVVLVKTTNDSSRVQLLKPEFNFAKTRCRAEVKKAILNVNCKNDACYKSIYLPCVINMHQCPFVVSAYHNPPLIDLSDRKNPRGDDVILLNLFGELINSKIEIVETMEEGCGSYADEKWSGTLGEVAHHRANASICGNYAKEYVEHFYTSVPYSFSDAVWISRAPNPLAPWTTIVRPLQFKLWIAIFILFVMIVAINFLAVSKTFRNLGRPFEIVIFQRNLLFNSLVIFLGMPVRSITNKASNLLIIYAWVWFCFVIRNSYEAGLLSSIIGYATEDTLQSIQEAYKLGRPFGGALDLKKYYRNEPEIYNNWITLNKSVIYDTLRAITHENSDFILAINLDNVAYRVTSKPVPRKAYILRNIIVHTPRVLYYRDDSIWAKSTNRILKTMYEFGILQIRNRFYRQFRKHIDTDRIRNDAEAKALKYKDYKGVYSVLFAGWALSLLTFLCELVVDKLERKFNNF